MRVALAQINSVLGDFSGNRDKILAYIERARAEECDLIVFPEAALFGYHPNDLLERPSLVAEQEKCLKELSRQIPKGMAALVGAIVRNTTGSGKGFWNAAIWMTPGAKPKILPKTLLPTYDVFDESRHVEPGNLKDNVVRFKGARILVTVCEDIWGWPRKDNPFYSTYGRNPVKEVKPRAVDLVVNLSASPFTQTKFKNRRFVTSATAKYLKAPLIYVNMVGAQDELIFDGGSFATDAAGKVIAQSPRFVEHLNVVDTKRGGGDLAKIQTDAQEVTHQALVLGIRDFIGKTGIGKVVIGLSGGIDSALVACLAVDALGAPNVTCVYLPGPYSADVSRDYAFALAKNLGVRIFEIPIAKSYEVVKAGLETALGPAEFGLMHENLQSRLRGVMLMAITNREGGVVLGTSNKSEFAVGYTTLYGDMIGALAPIGDLLKGEVYRLSEHYNREREVIPRGIITRPPSAELRANQTDQDSLPPYEELDAAVRNLTVGARRPRNQIESRVLDLMFRSEFKRWQAAPVLKVSDHAFGRGRRFPIAHKARG